MVTIREAVARLVSFFRKNDRDREFDQELAAHIEMATADHIREGVPAAEARRRALARLGGIEPAKQLHREARGMPLLDGLIQDVRYSVRTLGRSPVFTIAAVATLAIGIGATTAIFSTVNATLLRPLPYPAAGQLVDVHTRYVDGRVTTGLVATSEIATLRNLPGVAGVGGVNSSVLDATWIGDDGMSTSVAVRAVTAGFFDVFGLPMALGRAFTTDEHRGGRDVATSAIIVSHRAWVQLFGRDPHIVGKAVRIAEFPEGLIVTGVAAPEMDFPAGTDFWVNGRYDDLDHGSHSFNAVVRLQPGMTMAQLLSAGNLAMAELGKTVPQAVGREFLFQSLLTSIVGDLRPILLIVLGATLLLLLLACVNVTNLLLAKGATQAHEIAMRTALGAGRGRIVRQLMTQSMVLSTAGTLAGLALGYVAVRFLATLGAADLPRLETIPFDWRVSLFALVVLLVTGIGIGVMPALSVADTDLKTVLNEHGRRTTSSRVASRVMSGMIVAEVALAIALVAGAGWLIQSFALLRAIDPGFATTGRLLIDVKPTASSSSANPWKWERELRNRVRSAAGDALVGAAATFPMQPDRDVTINIDLLTETPDPNRAPSTRVRAVTPGFFEAVGAKLLAGRTFTEDDREATQRVAIINRAFARKYFPETSAIGRAFAYGYPVSNRANPTVIVGVIDDIRYKALSQEDEATFYLPQAQWSLPMRRHWLVVSSPDGRAAALIPQIRAALGEFDPGLSATFTTSEAVIEDALKRQELGMTLMMVFGATALTLAAIGLYGVIAYAAAQRRGELATRIALGASGRQVFWLMMSDGHRLMAIGVMLGLALAYVAGRIVSGSVFEMRAADPVVLLTAGALVASVAWFATMVPAIRASRQNPVSALRD